mmetsp:Transcript_32263/g.55767  ORF Transcript_32263/g.55767 Transcript_32263/m.55767 type:complete len:146 (-) Transcript_32263:205-642(-)
MTTFRLRPREAEEGVVPFMYEVWSWEGDASILPVKWFDFLQRVDSSTGTHYYSHLTKERLIEDYVQSDNFDPDSFFFITQRSEVAGSALLWPTLEGECELLFVAVHESHRDRVRLTQKVGEALLSIALDRALKLGMQVVSFTAKE